MKDVDLKEFTNIVFNNKPLEIQASDRKRVEESYQFLKSFSFDKIIYGINTGFGPMAQYRINDEDLKSLQYNIIRSHSSGAGNALPEIYVKAAMLCRYQTFIKGKSGVHIDTVTLLQSFINRGIYPYIPEHGGVGASGDLVQLAHLALALIGEGEVFIKDKTSYGRSVKRKICKHYKLLFVKDWLTNGTSVMTGVGLINLIYAKNYCRTLSSPL